MTNQHPLTDEICEGLVTFPLESEHDYIEMRAAADWQLEQVIDWLKNCNMNHSLSYDGEYRSDRYLVINAFREAMRPQEDN
jgi:hypothetical protein